MILLSHSFSSMRIHTSREPILELRDSSELLEVAGKPVGLWWSANSEWLSWCARNSRKWIHPHNYAIKLGEDTRIAMIASREDFVAFTDEFGVRHERWHQWFEVGAIDWQAVARSYDGIEILDLVAWNEPIESPTGQVHRSGVIPQWIRGMQPWDVPSGCVWRPGSGTRLEEVSPQVVHDWLLEARVPPVAIPTHLTQPTLSVSRLVAR